jgi:4-hydroxy-4-methyl-2-oxoglutarate aldolase
MPPESTTDRRWKFPVLPFIVGETPPPADPAVIDALARFYVPDISDVVGRMYTMHNISSIFDPAIALVGPATTAKCPPGDNLAVKKALVHVRPGDVLVVDA